MYCRLIISFLPVISKKLYLDCVLGLELCIQRLPQNYKALYRLAHVYYNYKAKKDFSKSKQLLLSQYKCSKDGVLINGLFSERKPNNFFNVRVKKYISHIIKISFLEYLEDSVNGNRQTWKSCCSHESLFVITITNITKD